LIRGNDPDMGLIPPVRFIPVLEATGLILEVGEWVMSRALFDYCRWRDAGLQPPPIAVNVSAVQFRRQNLAAIVRDVLERSGAGAGALGLEITESLILEDIDANTRTLQEIGAMGVSIAIDDFGTGYSSLQYLAKLPVDTLKIDRSFIITMADDPDSMTIVSAVISLAHALNLVVVAEGVDADNQAQLLKQLNCDQMQGYLFSKPVSMDECPRLLAGGKSP
jgi:EAL domain-containing protein (putative c-di-GMP-specific phosphodiesterase class I)